MITKQVSSILLRDKNVVLETKLKRVLHNIIMGRNVFLYSFKDISCRCSHFPNHTTTV